MAYIPCYKQCGKLRKHLIKRIVQIFNIFWVGILLIINLNKNN